MNVFGHDVQARYWESVENRCENVESMMLGVLAVAAAAWALNLPVDLICAGLRTFDAAPGCIGN